MILFLFIVRLLAVAPRTACSLESIGLSKDGHSCTQASVLRPEHSTCVLILIGVSFEQKLSLPEKSCFLTFPLSNSSSILPCCVQAPAPKET